jgi:peptidyl-prolyl cis-trans isomerase A (cyclophilin A)
MKTLKWAALVIAVGMLFSGCKSKPQPSETPTPEQPKAEAPAATTPAPAVSAPAKKEVPPAAPHPGFDHALLKPAMLRAQAPEKYDVKFDTTRGAFTITVTRAWAPLGADRFYNLVKHHFYDDAAFFRVVPGFVVQFGISAQPAVSAAWEHTEFKDDSVTHSNKRGTISFATAGPNTRTTQVFINLKDNAGLDGMGFAPFGVVDGQGMNVVEMMYEGYGDANAPNQDQLQKLGDPYLKKGWPKLDYIKTATLVPDGPMAAPPEGSGPTKDQ